MKNGSFLRTGIATLAIAFVAATAAFAQPKLEIVGGDTHDWGKVSPGKLTTEVQVKNVGNQELKISEVRPGCGCTAAPIDKNVLAPGEVGKISVTLDVSGRAGAVDKIITITSNDTVAPSRVLHLKADVHRAITCTPMQYMLVTGGKMGVEAEASSMKIKNSSDATITIQAPELLEGGNIALRSAMTAARELKPGEEFDLKVWVTPKNATSLFGTVRLKTSSTEMPTIDVTINGAMQQPNPQPSATQPSNTRQSVAPQPSTQGGQPSSTPRLSSEPSKSTPR